MFGVWQGTVLVSYGCHNKLPQGGCIRTTEIYFPTVLEVGSLDSRCQQADSFLEALEDKLSIPLPYLLAAASSPRHSLACKRIIPVSLSIFTLCSSLCLCPSFSVTHEDSPIGFRASPKPIGSHLNPYLNYICQDLISK